MVSFTVEPGVPTLRYDYGFNVGAPSFSAALVTNASANKIAMIGQVWHPNKSLTSISIRKVHFRCGAIASFNAASEFRVSLQNISATAGPPYQPDGTQDQFYDFKTATTALTQNAVNTTGNLSGDRTVDLTADSFGDTNSRWLAVVFEWQAFNTSDSVIISSIPDFAGYGLGGAISSVGATWSAQARQIVVYFELDDGSFAYLVPGTVFTATGTVTVTSTGAIRRAGVKFKVPTSRIINRLGLHVGAANGYDGRLVLYDSDGTTELISVDVDNDAVVSFTTNVYEIDFQPVTLAAETFYRFVWVAGTTTAGTVPYFDVAATAHLNACMLGANAMWTQHDGSSWADTALRRPGFAIGVYAYESPGGGGSKVIGG